MGKSPILELEVEIIKLKERSAEALKSAFIDGLKFFDKVNVWDEEEINDAWMLSETYRKLTAEE